MNPQQFIMMLLRALMGPQQPPIQSQGLLGGQHAQISSSPETADQGKTLGSPPEPDPTTKQFMGMSQQLIGPSLQSLPQADPLMQILDIIRKQGLQRLGNQ